MYIAVEYQYGCIIFQALYSELTISLLWYVRLWIITHDKVQITKCYPLMCIIWSKWNAMNALTLLALPWCSASYGEIYNIHSEPYEEREAFCLPRGSHNLIPGKYNQVFRTFSLGFAMNICFFTCLLCP